MILRNLSFATATMLATAAAVAQTTPVPADPAVVATPAPVELTDKEKSTLLRCSRLTPAEQAQSSKCSAVMSKAGKGDPAKARSATPTDAERR